MMKQTTNQTAGQAGGENPLRLIQETTAKIEPQDVRIREEAARYIETLTMPTWALGRLLDLAVDLCGITRTLKPAVANKRIILMAGDHGVTAQGVCSQPKEITRQMVELFFCRRSALGVLAKQAGADVTLVDMGVDADFSEAAAAGKILDRKIARSTADFTVQSAMSRDEALRGIAAGIELTRSLADTVDVFGLGEMGIGNTTPAAAILTVMIGAGDPAPYVGRGAGLDDDGLNRKIEAIRKGIALNKPDRSDPIDVLAKIGGFEIAGMTGVILGAAAERKPVLLDGLITCSAALLAQQIAPTVTDFLIASHTGAEPGHRVMLERLGKQGLLEWNLRLGEGTGAALAFPALDAAGAILTEMATFDEAAVSFRRLG